MIACMGIDLGSLPGVRAAGRGYVLGVHGGTLVLLASRLDRELMLAERRLLQSESSDIVCMLSVFEAEFQLPDDETRLEMDEFVRELGSRPVAVVYEAGGFTVAAIRAINTSYARMTDNRLRPQIFESLASAVGWLKAETRGVSGVDDLEAYVATLRAAQSAT